MDLFTFFGNQIVTVFLVFLTKTKSLTLQKYF